MAESRVSKATVVALVYGAIFPVLLFALHQLTRIHLADTDRHFHLAVSRIISEQGALWIHSLPQVEGLGWGAYFPDKDFLFHVFTSIGFRFGGESGAVAVGLIASLGCMWLTYGFALLFLSPGLAFLSVASLFFHHALVFRLLFFRPFVFAMFGFILLNVGLLRKKPWIAGAGAAFFALSYHAFYFPILCCGLYALVGKLAEARDRRLYYKTALFGICGLAIGTVMNPFFPSNVSVGFLQAYGNYLAQHELSGVRFGAEIYPLTAPAFVKFFGIPGIVLVAAIAHLARGLDKKTARLELLYLVLLSGFFAAVSAQSVRGGEYFFPSISLLLIFLVRDSLNAKYLKPALGSFAALQAVFLLQVALTEARAQPDLSLEADIEAAVGAIPVRGAKVFNCDWAQGAYLLKLRPDLRFIDILDPLSLYFHDWPAFEMREKLRNGAVADASEAIQKMFGAEFVLCSRGSLVEQLRADPSAREVFLANGSLVHLFRLQPAKNFVKEWSARELQFSSSEEARNFLPDASPAPEFVPTNPGRIYLDLQFTDSSVPLRCAQLKVPPSELAAWTGASYLGIGGGPAIRAWRNGKPLFASGEGFATNRSVQALVPLNPPVDKRDRFEFLYCGRANGFLGAAVSFWSSQELEKICSEKRKVSPRDGAWLTTDQRTCLAPLAQPAPPVFLRP